MDRTTSPRKWLLSAIVLAVAILVPELALRAFGFEYGSGVQFGYPDPKTMAFFETDELLFWKLKTDPDREHARQDIAGNTRGFQGPDPEIPKPAGVYRALFLGDSCTFQGYPWQAAVRMSSLGIPADRRAEAVSFAIPGYTSLQGLRAAQAFGLELAPDVVFVFFGWNDHWAAYGQIDSKKDLRPPNRAVARIAAAAFEHSRLAQATAWIAAKLGGKGKPLALPRVLPEEYRENLTAIVGLFAARGVPVVLLTAPTSFYRLGVPQRLVDDGFARSGDDAIRLHREYNAIAREVASKAGARLLDLEKECEDSPDLEKRFLKDGIHFSPDGRAWVADRIANFVRDDVLRADGK